MNSLIDSMKGYTAHVVINPDSKGGGYRLAIGLLGKPYLTSPALTKQIQESPEFDQLDGSAKAERILAMVLAHAQE